MVWALLPLLLLTFIFGFTAIERDLAEKPVPAAPLQPSAASAAAQEFMAYRNAIISYVKQMPVQQSGVSAPLSALGLPADPLLTNAGNMLVAPIQTGASVPTSSSIPAQTGYYICAWMKAPAGTVGQLVNQLGGDLTVGTVLANGTSWMQAGPGGQVLPIPTTCYFNPYTLQMGIIPPGDVISVVGILGG